MGNALKARVGNIRYTDYSLLAKPFPLAHSTPHCHLVVTQLWTDHSGGKGLGERCPALRLAPVIHAFELLLIMFSPQQFAKNA